jgi:hypothetical protein
MRAPAREDAIDGFDHLVIAAHHAHDLGAGHDRVERIAQIVAEYGGEHLVEVHGALELLDGEMIDVLFSSSRRARARAARGLILCASAR